MGRVHHEDGVEVGANDSTQGRDVVRLDEAVRLVQREEATGIDVHDGHSLHQVPTTLRGVPVTISTSPCRRACSASFVFIPPIKTRR